MKAKAPWLLAVLALAGTVAAILTLTRPTAAPPSRPQRVTEVERRPDELPAARDEENHYAPGSPAAVAERFLRLRLRYHYDGAAELATAGERARCLRNVQQFTQLDPEQREGVRQAQLIAEAARFDLEQAVTEELPATAEGVARRRVRGTMRAVGPVAGRTVESRREQVLVLHLLEGAWRVAEWTPAGVDAGIVMH